jgi:hypothetical protein
VQIETQALKKIQERREKIERDIAAFEAKGGKVQSLDVNQPATQAKPRFKAGFKE